MGIWQRYDGVSVENGSSSVTVAVATLQVYTRAGDGASFDGGIKWYEVNAAADNQHFSIVGSFDEATITNGSVIIDNRSYRHQIESDILETMRATLAGQTQVIETSGPPNPNVGADKSLAFDADARCYYHKVAGVWGDAVQLGGADGVDAGFQFAFDATVGIADPGAGKLRFNNATFASITAIAIDDQSNDIGNPDVSAYIVSQFAASTSAIKGTLILRKVGSSAFRVFSITGLTDNSGWTQLTVLPVASAGTFATGDKIAVSFIRNGDKGETGTAGVNAGFTMALDRSTNAIADPGTAKARFDNNAFNATNNIALDDLSAETGNPSVAASIARWSASTNAVKGKLHIRKVGQPQNFVIFDVMSVAAQTGWTQIGVAFEASGGTLMTNDVCAFVFAPAGDEGIDGTNGIDGINSGFTFAFDTSVTMADPGTGKLRFDSATLASVANVAIDDLSAATGNPDVSASILIWDSSTNANMRGTLRITKRGDEATYVEFAINGATHDMVGWSQLAVSLISSHGTLANNDLVIVSATRSGDKGLDGDGAGDVVGPTGVTDGNLAAFDTSTGKRIKDSGVAPSADGTFAANSDSLIPTQKAVGTFVNLAIAAQIAASDVEVLKGPIDCSGNPNYPSADAGHVYRVSAAGRIGGATGPIVEVNDRLECYVDGSASGNHATVGGNWIISQVNIDGAMTGPAAATSGNIPTFNGSSGKVLQDSGRSIASLEFFRNRVINPSGRVAQNTLAVTADCGYAWDQWYIPSESGSITPSIGADAANGVPTYMITQNSFASAQRWGFAQPFESALVRDMRGSTASVSFTAICSAATTVRWALIEWTGTADTITRDIVNNWASGTFTPGNFFASSNLIIVGTGSQVLPAGVAIQCVSNTIGTVSGAMNNLILFIWTDSQLANGGLFDIWNVWMGRGSFAPTSFELPNADEDLRRCQRYLWVPFQDAANNIAAAVSGTTVAGNVLSMFTRFPVPMRAAPTMNTPATKAVYVASVSWSAAVTGVALGNATKEGGLVTATGGSGFSNGLTGAWTGSPLIFNAQL